MSGEGVDPELLRALASAGPTRAQVRLRRGLALAGSVAAAVVVFLLAGGLRDGGAPRPPVLTALTFAGTLLVAAGALWIASGRSRSSPLGPPRAALVAVVALAPVLVFAWKMAVSVWFDGATEWLFPERVGLRCLGLSLGIAAVFAPALVLARRGTDPIHPRLTGAALGVAAGAVAAVLVDLWCPVGNPIHVLLGHVLPIVVHGALGALLWGRLLRMDR